MQTVEEKCADQTQDGSVDLKGRPISRSKTGRWKAAFFIIVYEIFERIAYHGVASNLVMYLSRQFNEGTVKSTSIVNNWAGTAWLMPILGAYIADTHLGRFWTFIIASIIYLSGMSLLALSALVPSLKPPCDKNDKACNLKASPLQRGVFFLALYIIAIGNGGTKPNISSMGADQFDDLEPKEKLQKMSFFNWWMSGIFIGSLIANTIMMQIQDKLNTGLGYAIQAIGLGFGIFLFLVGCPFYRHKKPQGNSYAKMLQVLVAAFRKWWVPNPNDPKELHELRVEDYAKMGEERVDNTPALRFLDKAAVKTGPTSPWMLCTVTQVEETKKLVKMIPIMIATIIPSMIFAQVTTLFIKQGSTLNLKLGPKFAIPPASLKATVQIFMLVSVALYDRLFVPFLRRRTKNPRGITMLQRMGIGMFLYITIMIAAYLAERKRVEVARANRITADKGEVPLSVFIILPQFALVGIADTFLEVAKLEFFYDQAPAGMKSLGTSYYSSSMGIGSFLSVFLLNFIANVTKRNGRPGWITNNINLSRLDYFYALGAGLTVINFFYFIVVARRYVYNAEPKEQVEDEFSLEMEELPAIDDTIETKEGVKLKH